MKVNDRFKLICGNIAVVSDVHSTEFTYSVVNSNGEVIKSSESMPHTTWQMKGYALINDGSPSITVAPSTRHYAQYAHYAHYSPRHC